MCCSEKRSQATGFMMLFICWWCFLSSDLRQNCAWAQWSMVSNPQLPQIHEGHPVSWVLIFSQRGASTLWRESLVLLHLLPRAAWQLLRCEPSIWRTDNLAQKCSAHTGQGEEPRAWRTSLCHSRVSTGQVLCFSAPRIDILAHPFTLASCCTAMHAFTS